MALADIVRLRRSAALILITATAMCFSCSKSATKPVPLTREEQHELFLNRLTEMLRSCNLQFDRAVESVESIDTLVIPGNNWPYAFADQPVTQSGNDSIRTTLVANSGDANENWHNTEDFWFWGDSLPLPPSAEHPLDQVGYALNHSHRSGGESWSDRFSIQIQNMTSDTVRSAYSFSATYMSHDQCFFVPCEYYQINFVGRFEKKQGDGQLENPIKFPASVFGYIADFAGPDSTGYPRALKWNFRGQVLSGWQAILETDLEDFTATDTIFFAPTQ